MKKTFGWLLMNYNDTPYEGYDNFAIYKEEKYAKSAFKRSLGEYIVPCKISYELPAKKAGRKGK